MPKNKEFLINHMNKHKDTIIIVGNKIYNDFNVSNDRLGEVFSKRFYKRFNKAFWKFFNENLKKEYKTDIFKILEKNIDNYKVFNTSIIGNPEGVLLRGTVETITCSKCGIVFSKDIVPDEIICNIECEVCGTSLSPDVLFSNQQMSQENYDLFIDSLNNTHTVILLGVDLTEDFIIQHINLYGDLKKHYNANAKEESEEKILVSLSKENEKFDVSDITFPEFSVKGDIEESLKRLFR